MAQVDTLTLLLSTNFSFLILLCGLCGLKPPEERPQAFNGISDDLRLVRDSLIILLAFITRDWQIETLSDKTLAPNHESLSSYLSLARPHCLLTRVH